MPNQAQSPFPADAPGNTHTAGERIDEGRGRIFPCPQCGADLVYHIGQQQLACTFCGVQQPVSLPPGAEIVEQDYAAMLQRLRQRKEHDPVGQPSRDTQEVRCASCGANVVFQGTLTSQVCPYCASPLQRDQVHDADNRIPVDAVLPFLIPRERAAQSLRNWVKSLWFTPNDFQHEGVQGKFQGCYYPYYTFDAITYTRWAGERGEHEWETEQQGNETRQVRRTRWIRCSGAFERVFDDVLVLAIRDDRAALLQRLAPWPLHKCQPYSPHLLAGFFARTYDVSLEQGFALGRERMEAAIQADIQREIGGDEQRIIWHKTAYRAITFKHVLLPVWLMAYRYRGKVYRVTINAATGEVQGERPWSWVKILVFISIVLFVLLVLYGMLRS